MPPLTRPLLLAIGLAAFALAPAGAEERPAIFKGLMDCKAMTDPSERLACYDAAVGALDSAEQKGDIVVVDREQAKAVRRQAFGFSLPSLSIFDRTGRPEEVEQVTAQVERAYLNPNAKWVVVLEDGAVWEQIDNQPVPRRPRAGSKAEIRRAALGSFFMNLDGQRAVRARRVR